MVSPGEQPALSIEHEVFSGLDGLSAEQQVAHLQAVVTGLSAELVGAYATLADLRDKSDFFERRTDELQRTNNELVDTVINLSGAADRVAELTDENEELLDVVDRLGTVEDAGVITAIDRDIAHGTANQLMTRVDELEDQVARDPLTGLLNRRAFTQILDRHLDVHPVTGDRASDGGAVLFFDGDKFKQINDTQGHAAGDKLLLEIAAALSRNCRVDDIIARLGGDEFVALLPGIGKDIALEIARKLYKSVEQATGMRMSCGVTVLGRDDTARAAIHRADKAMYWTKYKGDGGPMLFETISHGEDAI